MRITLRLLCLGIMFYAILPSSFGQVGVFDVRFVFNDYDCNTRELFIDVEVKANDAANEYNLSDQNYRFSWNRTAIAAVNPPIDAPQTNPPDRSVFIFDELTISNFVAQEGTNSFYDAHTLTGSIDTVCSDNVKLAGGDGYPLHFDTWVKVNRLRFNIIDGSVCLDLLWHDHATFPPTFIGEKFAGILFEVTEGTYGNFNMCFDPGCPLPVELTTFEGVDKGCENHISWETATEINSDYFILERSFDGDRFEVIAQLPGAGNSSEGHAYSFVDKNVGVTNYYRLSQVDFDGTVNQHETIIVRSSCFDGNILNGISELYPNPVSQDETITLKFYTDKLDTSADILVTDVLGRQVDAQAIEITQGANSLIYNPERLSSGTYFMQIRGDEWFSSPQKFVKVTN